MVTEDEVLLRVVIAGRLRQARLTAKVTQKTIANLLKTNTKTISLMEAGKQKIPAELIGVWCERLKCNIGYILTGKNEYDKSHNSVEQFTEQALKTHINAVRSLPVELRRAVYDLANTQAEYVKRLIARM